MAEMDVAVGRLGPLLVKIRESLCKTLDAFRSKAFHGSLDEVLSVSPEDINTTASYLVNIGLTREDGQQFCDEWEQCWKEGGALQVLVRNPPPALDYPASADDPDDPWLARFNQAAAERSANHQGDTDRQRGIAMDALLVLLAHVDDVIRIVNAMNGGEADRWIKVSEAEKISGFNRGTISRAAKKGEIVTNEKLKHALRLHSGSFSQWVLKRSSVDVPHISSPAPGEIEKRAREERKQRGPIDDN